MKKMKIIDRLYFVVLQVPDVGDDDFAVLRTLKDLLNVHRPHTQTTPFSFFPKFKLEGFTLTTPMLLLAGSTDHVGCNRCSA